MINVIEASERKLKEAHEKIKSVMSDGTPSERLLTVSRFFVECDIGDKGYLSPSEFSDLSSNLGVHLTTAELREAMLLIDEDGNGQVEMIEYIEWCVLFFFIFDSFVFFFSCSFLCGGCGWMQV